MRSEAKRLLAARGIKPRSAAECEQYTDIEPFTCRSWGDRHAYKGSSNEWLSLDRAAAEVANAAWGNLTRTAFHDPDFSLVWQLLQDDAQEALIQLPKDRQLMYKYSYAPDACTDELHTFEGARPDTVPYYVYKQYDKDRCAL